MPQRVLPLVVEMLAAWPAVRPAAEGEALARELAGIDVDAERALAGRRPLGGPPRG